jgi:hypothetical protein
MLDHMDCEEFVVHCSERGSDSEPKYKDPTPKRCKAPPTKHLRKDTRKVIPTSPVDERNYN